MQQVCCFRWAPKAKRFSASGGFAPNPLTRSFAPGPHWGSAPRPHYRLALHALAMHVYPTFFDLATPLDLTLFMADRIVQSRPGTGHIADPLVAVVQPYLPSGATVHCIPQLIRDSSDTHESTL